MEKKSAPIEHSPETAVALDQQLAALAWNILTGHKNATTQMRQGLRNAFFCVKNGQARKIPGFSDDKESEITVPHWGISILHSPQTSDVLDIASAPQFTLIRKRDGTFATKQESGIKLDGKTINAILNEIAQSSHLPEK